MIGILFRDTFSSYFPSAPPTMGRSRRSPSMSPLLCLLTYHIVLLVRGYIAQIADIYWLYTKSYERLLKCLLGCRQTWETIYLFLVRSALCKQCFCCLSGKPGNQRSACLWRIHRYETAVNQLPTNYTEKCTNTVKLVLLLDSHTQN